MLQERAELIATRLPTHTVSDHEYPLQRHPDATVPLCPLRLDGATIRPVNSKAKGNAVCLQRVFGSRATAPPPAEEIDALLATMAPDEVREALLTKVYTHGTAAGFDARLGMISSDKCKTIYGQVRGGKEAKMKHLNRLLPIDPDLLPDWNGGDGDLLELLKTVDVTKHASAGAPYWKKKGDCMEQIFHVIELVCERMKGGELGKLLQEQPELFVIECKNKQDRYDVSKLETKTRPIFNPPAHFSLLASFLMQGFSKALLKVGGPVPTCNAYGWSAAKGGITNLVADVKRRHAKGERGWCYVYSDDGDVYFPAQGHLWRVSPDIKQMDSCVDFDTVELTWDFVQYSYEQKHGESLFWNMVIDALKQIFKEPRIMVSGTQLYTKPKDGLLSGSVGTTLYGTVKSAVCYTDLLEAHAHNPALLLKADYVGRYMKDMYGLVVKEGTWMPEIVNLDPQPAFLTNEGRLVGAEEALYGQGKFLGVQYVLVAGPNGVDWMPWLPDAAWASCILVPRQGDEDLGGSQTSSQRTQFDRVRGYLTTGGAFSHRVLESMRYLVDRLPSEVILMQPQGTTPPEGIILGDEMSDFEYPTPEFMPDPFWVHDIYATPGNLYSKPHTQIFSDEVLASVAVERMKKRKIRMTMDTKTQALVVEEFAPKPPLTIGVEMDVVKQEPQHLGSHWKGPTPVRAEERPAAVPNPGIPYDMAYQQTERQALTASLALPPPPDFHPVVTEEVLTLREAVHMIDGEEQRVPVTWRTGDKATSLVHKPTPAGMLAGMPQMHADLVYDLLHHFLTTFTAIPPTKTPQTAYNMIFAANKCHGKFKFEQKTVAKGGGKKGNMIEGRFMLSRYVHVVKPDGTSSVTTSTEPTHVQTWVGETRGDIKDAIRVYVLEANKRLGTAALQQEQAKDWSLGATASKVPYSEVAGDARPKPPPVLTLAACPATVPVERASGDVDMSCAPLPDKKVEWPATPWQACPPPPEMFADITFEDMNKLTVPPPPEDTMFTVEDLERALKERASHIPTLPTTLQPYEPLVRIAPEERPPSPPARPAKSNQVQYPVAEVRPESDLSKYLDRLKRSRGDAIAVSSDEDELFENAVPLLDDEGGSEKVVYMGVSQIEEVFRYVGMWTSGHSPLEPQNIPDYHAVASLRKLLSKTLDKIRKANIKDDRKPEERSQEKAKEEGPPPLPPRKPRQAREEARQEDRRPPRNGWRPSFDRGRPNWGQRPQYPRTGYRPFMDKRDR